jgi:chromosome segregation ATPase
MTSLTQPADYSVAELKDALEGIDDPEELERLLDAERDGENRVTATEAIEQRLEAVGADDASDAGVDADGADDDEAADDEAADADDGSVEETWDENTTVASRDRVAPAATATETDGNAVERLRDEAMAESADAAHGSLDLSTTQAEAMSLSTNASGLEDDLGQQLVENLERIRHSFEDASEEGGRVEARIRHLQNEVSDLKAYTNALEEFLDEEGTGRQVIESVRADMAALEGDLAEVTSDVGIHGRNLGKLWEVIEDIENELSRFHEIVDRQRRELGDVAEDVDAVESALQEVRETADERYDAQRSRLDDLDETLDAHADSLDDHAGTLDAQRSRLDDLDETLDAHAGSLDDHAGTLDDHADTLDDHAGTLDDLDDGVSAVEQEIDIVGTDVDDVSDRLDTVAGDLGELDASVDDRFAEGSEARAALSARIDENAAAIDDLASTVDDIAADVDSLEQLVGGSGRVDQRFESIEEEIETLQEWREQLSSVILGGGDPSAADQ